MLTEIKKELLKNPYEIAEILEQFEFSHINVHDKYISFGRNDKGSGKSIVIKLINNDYLMVKDYPKNLYLDFFSYIIYQKCVEFNEVMGVVKRVLNITDYYDYFNDKTVFGGFYDRIKKKKSNFIETYEDSILDKFSRHGNLRFLRDNIPLYIQKQFNICYDIESQGIVIPIYDQFGQIMGIKIRANYDVGDGDLKYYYHLPCLMSETLYGYSQNYKYLCEGVVYIFEAEKSVMQAFGFGIRNCIALGSSTISKKQIKMIMELHPSRVIFLHDKGLEFEVIERNIKLFKLYHRMSDVEIGYWDFNQDKGVPEKSSPSDLGKIKFLEIINTQIAIIEG